MQEDAEELVLATIGLLAVFANTCRFLYQVRLGGLTALLQKYLGIPGQEKASEIEMAVQQEIKKRQFESMVGGLSIYSHGYGSLVALMMLSKFLDMDDAHCLAFCPSFAEGFVLTCISILVLTLSFMVSSDFIVRHAGRPTLQIIIEQFFFSIVMASHIPVSILGQVRDFGDPINPWRQLCVSFVVRSAAALVTHRLDLVVFWNLLHVLIVGFFLELPSHDRINFSQMNLVMSLVIIFTSKWSTDNTKWEARASIYWSQEEQQHQASKALLTSICDAVVELDCNLRLVEEAPHLRAMLLRSARSLQKGAAFESYLATEDDQNQFLAHMEKAMDGAAMATAFHLNAKCSHGEILPIECFHVKFQVAGSTGCRHMLGIRENSESWQEAVYPEALPDLTEPWHLPLPGNHVEIVGENAIATFNALNLQTLEVSEAFARLVGQTSDKQLITDFLPLASRKSFMQELTQQCNAFLNAENVTYKLNVTHYLEDHGNEPGRYVWKCASTLMLSKTSLSADDDSSVCSDQNPAMLVLAKLMVYQAERIERVSKSVSKRSGTGSSRSGSSRGSTRHSPRGTKRVLEAQRLDVPATIGHSTKSFEL